MIAIQTLFEGFEVGDMKKSLHFAAFHQTMPPKAFMYAVPYDLYKQRGLRRYGAHGTSVQYLVKRASQMLQKSVENVNLIVAHLGKSNHT